MSQIYTTPSDVIVNFFGLLNEKHYDEAFDCLTPDFQERIWKNDRADFAKGYAYTINIGNVAYKAAEENEDRAEYHVFYSDTINALHHPLMDGLPKMSIGELPQAIANIESFNALMINDLGANPKEVDKILLSHYFAKNNVETCLWLGKADYSKNDELFTRSAETLQVYRRAVCVNQDGWKIDGLKRS